MPDNTKRGMLFIHAQTPLHPGSGSALGVVDLPVQRERHTDWPVIPGSSIKGVVRATVEGAPKDDGVFGSRPGAGELKASNVSFSDARILAFPVRSLLGVFGWCTCPEVLRRFKRDLEMAGLPHEFEVPMVNSATGAIFAAGSPLLSNGLAVLEEFEITAEGGSIDRDILEAVRQACGVEELLAKRLVILHDDQFTHFVRHATEVTARIGLDYETKTVKDGALFYQEFLPAETAFYAGVSATERNGTTAERAYGEVRNGLGGAHGSYLQLGGDETIGKGFCKVTMTEGN